MRTEPRGNRKIFRTGRVTLFVPVLALLAGCLLLGLTVAADQPPTGNSVQSFKAPLDYFPPPHERQMRSFLEGSQSEMGPNGTVILHDAKLQTFNEDGSREMIVNAPQCVYDYNKRVATSSGALQVLTWDAKTKRASQLEGTNGFYWQQTNSFLIVSNKQTTTISGPLTNSLTP